MGYKVHDLIPAVENLPIHLLDKYTIILQHENVRWNKKKIKYTKIKVT